MINPIDLIRDPSLTNKKVHRIDESAFHDHLPYNGPVHVNITVYVCLSPSETDAYHTMIKNHYTYVPKVRKAFVRVMSLLPSRIQLVSTYFKVDFDDQYHIDFTITELDT